jgi:hypothetical protein
MEAVGAWNGLAGAPAGYRWLFGLVAGLVQVRDGQGVRQLPGRRTLHSHRAGGGHVVPELVDATPDGNLLGSGEPGSRLVLYPCFGHDVAPLLHDCGLSGTIRVLKLEGVCLL